MSFPPFKTGTIPFGIPFAFSVTVLHLDQGAPPTPELPRHRFGVPTQFVASAALHVMVFGVLALIRPTAATLIDIRRPEPAPTPQIIDLRHIVFLAPEEHRVGGGGGGGGNRQPGPIRRAQGVGSDAVTLRVRPSPSSAVRVTDALTAPDDVAALPAVVLDAKPLASGLIDQVGLPSGGVSWGISTGTGSGGGVGSGIGTGIGSGRGPGVGEGSGGGVGGGVYRPGAVTAPRVVTQVKPTYTNEALQQKIQGTVVLELIVTRDGQPSHIRVVRSLDPDGLDEEAVKAAAQWRFEPGRLAGTPVDVLVTIMLDFWIR